MLHSHSLSFFPNYPLNILYFIFLFSSFFHSFCPSLSLSNITSVASSNESLSLFSDFFDPFLLFYFFDGCAFFAFFLSLSFLSHSLIILLFFFCFFWGCILRRTANIWAKERYSLPQSNAVCSPASCLYLFSSWLIKLTPKIH